MKTHKMAFLPCVVIAGFMLLSPSAFGGAKLYDSKPAWTILLYGAWITVRMTRLWRLQTNCAAQSTTIRESS